MTSALLSESVLTQSEARKVRASISNRMHRLNRCRAVFDVQISESYRARPFAPPGLPESCRIIYQCAGEQAWQVTAYDEDGGVLSDSARDGAWIESGGKCWHHRYLGYSARESEEELDVNSEEEEDRIEEEHEIRISQLGHLLWPLHFATGHLLSDLSFVTNPLMRETWQFWRDTESERLVCRSLTNYHPCEFRFSTWEYFQWRFARLWQPGIDIMEYFGKKSLPRTQVELLLDEARGYMPENLGETDPTSTTDHAGVFETWNDPVSFAEGLVVPRIHRFRCASTDGDVLYHSTLISEESDFGVNITLNIRPLDRSLERVDW